MGFHRLKKNFTSGELSPLMGLRTENTRYLNGCKQLHNSYVKPQGPAVRRSGSRFVFNLSSLTNIWEGYYGDRKFQPRMEKFVYNEEQSYIIVFYKYEVSSEVYSTRFVILYDEGLVETSPGVPFVYEITGTFGMQQISVCQSNDKMFIAQPNRAPLVLNRIAHDDWNVATISFTSAPTDWSSSNGWPETVAFFEQRMAYGGNAIRPQTLWLSKSGDYYDFTVGTGTGALTFTLNSSQANNIQWLVTSQQLIVGTIGDEWTIGGVNGEPLTDANVKARKQTPRGSESLAPLQIDSSTIFLERLGRTVNMFLYDFNTDSFQITDLSILAPHLTERETIYDWTYQQTPNGIIWCVRSDGILIAMTFQKEHNVLGWHRHSTDGKYITIETMPASVFVEEEDE